MRKQLFAVMFALAVSLVINAGQTRAQSEAFRVSVPFDFSANNKTLPAGTYTVNSATGNRVIWRVQGENKKSVAIVMIGSLTGSADAASPAVTFRRYGDRYFLTAFTTRSFQVELPTSRDEKNLRPTLKLAKSDVVIGETTKSNGNEDEK